MENYKNKRKRQLKKKHVFPLSSYLRCRNDSAIDAVIQNIALPKQTINYLNIEEKEEVSLQTQCFTLMLNFLNKQERSNQQQQSQPQEKSCDKCLNSVKNKPVSKSTTTADLISEEKVDPLKNSVFEDFSDLRFFQQMGVTKRTFSTIVNMIKSTKMFRKVGGRSKVITSEMALQLLLFYVNGNNLAEVTMKFADVGGPKGTGTHSNIHKCIEAINKFELDVIAWPSDMTTSQCIEQDFLELTGISGIIGSLGSCCIEVRSSKEPLPEFKIGKEKTIIHLLAVADARMKFMYIQAGFPGTRRLQDALDASSLGQQLNLYDNSDLFLDKNHFLITASKEFCMQNRLMVPYMHTYNQACKNTFNAKLEDANTVTKSLMMLRARFPLLRRMYGMLDKMPTILKALCIIHNIALNDPEDGFYLQHQMPQEFKSYDDFRLRSPPNRYISQDIINKRDHIASSFYF